MKSYVLAIAVVVSLSVTCCWATQPQKANTATSKAKPSYSSAASHCHITISALEGKEFDWFADQDLSWIRDSRESIENCVREHYDELPRFDLVIATVATGWLQQLIDESEPAAMRNHPAIQGGPMLDLGGRLLQTGKVVVYPLDIGQSFAFTLGTESKTCKATSTKEIVCGQYETFEAVLVAQNGREYLAGCQFDSYESCADMPTGVYTIVVHGRTMTVMDSGLTRINTQTGRTLSSIVPVLSIFMRVK